MKKISDAILLFVLSLSVFYGFWLFGRIPFPGDYMAAWYEPWKTATQKDSGALGIPHKPVLDDVFRQLYPYKSLAADMLKKGIVPLWNPYNGSGTPLLAVMHAGFFTPLVLVFVLIPYPIAWGMYVALQPCLVSICMYMYCKKIGFKTSSSLFVISVLLFSSFFIVRYEYGEYIYVAACLPLILYGIETYRDHPKSRWLFMLPFIIAFMVFSGQPQMILYVGIVSILYALFRLRLRFFYCIPLVVLGFGLSAIQLLPTLELYVNSNMTGQASKFIFDGFLAPLSHLITIVIPNYFGNPSTYNYWGYADYVETACSIGLMPLFFVFYAVVCMRMSRALQFWIIIAIVSIVSTLNMPCIQRLYELGIPIFSTGIPTRIYFITTFALAIVSGYGFDIWIQDKHSKRKFWMAIGIVICFVFIITLWTVMQQVLHVSCPASHIDSCHIVALRNVSIQIGIFIFCIGLFISHAIIHISSKLRNIIPCIVIVIFVASGLYNAQKFLPYTKRDRIMPAAPVVDKILSESEFGRVIGLDEANIKTDFATYYRFYDPQQYDPLSIRRYAEFVSYANTGKFPPPLLRSDIEIDTHATVSAELEFRRNRLLDMLSVSMIVTKKDNMIWDIEKRRTVFPHAYMVSEYEVIPDGSRLLQRLFDPGFSVAKSVLLEYPVSEKIAPCGDESAIEMDAYQENTSIITTRTHCTGILVFTDTYYPGWKAYIDGKETKILRANYSLRAIIVPGDTHTIRFSYEPWSFKIGLYVSMVSFAAIIGMFIWVNKQ